MELSCCILGMCFCWDQENHVLEFLSAERNTLTITGAAGSNKRMLSRNGTLWTAEIITAVQVGCKKCTQVSANKTNSPLSCHSLWPTRFIPELLMQDHKSEISSSQPSLHLCEQHHPHLSGTHGHPAHVDEVFAQRVSTLVKSLWGLNYSSPDL